MKRWKGMIALTVALILAPLSTSYAAGGIPIKAVEGAKVDLSKYEIIHPTDLELTSGDKNMMVSGKAIPGSKVKIKLYGTSDLNKKSYDLDNLPKNDAYILLVDENLTTGNLGFFQKQLTLVGGVNKITLTFADENIAPVEILVYVQEKTADNPAGKKQIKISNVAPLVK